MPRRVLQGQVVSSKTDKTVTVLIERRFMHPVYKKFVKRTDRYKAHDEGNAFNEGDVVQIEECRPISRTKTWRVITVPAAGAVRPDKVTKAEETQAREEADRKAKAVQKESDKKVKADKAEAKKADTEAKATKKAATKKPAAKKETKTKK